MKRLNKIVCSSWFQNSIIGVILFAGVIVGLETSPSVMEQYGAVPRSKKNILGNL